MIIEGKPKLLEICQKVSSSYLKKFNEEDFKSVIEHPERLLCFNHTENSEEYYIVRILSYSKEYDIRNFLSNLLSFLYSKGLILNICSNIEVLENTINLVEKDILKIEEKNLYKIFAAIPGLMYLKT